MDNREENKDTPASLPTESGFGTKTYTITERDLNKCIRALEGLDTAREALLNLIQSTKQGEKEDETT